MSEESEDLIAEAEKLVGEAKADGMSSVVYSVLKRLIDALEALTTELERERRRGAARQRFVAETARHNEQLLAERDAALAAIERVREIHEQHPVVSTGFPALTTDYVYCANGCEYPCKTVAALDGAPEPEEKP